MYYFIPPHIYGILVHLSIYVYKWERTADLFFCWFFFDKRNIRYLLWCTMASNSFEETSATLFINAHKLVTVRPMMTQDINTPQVWVVILIVCLHKQFHFSPTSLFDSTCSISTVTMLNHYQTTNIHKSASYYHDSYTRASCVRYRQIRTKTEDEKQNMSLMNN